MPPTSQPSGPNTPGGEPYCDWKSWMKRRTSGRVDDPRSTHAHVTTVPSPAPAVVERYDSVFIADEPNSGIESAPPSVRPVRRSVAPGPDPVHATLPHPARSTRCTTPARASSSGRTSDSAMSLVPRSVVSSPPNASEKLDPSPTRQVPPTDRDDPRIAAASAADSPDRPATTRRHDDHPCAAREDPSSDRLSVGMPAPSGALQPTWAPTRTGRSPPPRTTDRPPPTGRARSRSTRPLRRPDRPPRGPPAGPRDRPPPGARAAGRGAREPPSARTREPTCRGGTRSSRARGRERQTARRPARARGRGRQRRRLAGQAGDDPPPRRPSLRGEGGPQLGQAERGDAGAVQERSNRRGLRPERADHRPPRTTDRPPPTGRARSPSTRPLRRPDRPPRAPPAGLRDRPPPAARAAGRRARESPSARTREPTCHGGTRSSRARGRERQTARRPRPCTRWPGSRPGRPERRRSRGVGSCRFGSPRTRERADGWVV